MTIDNADIAIVGAGPAGMAAAIEAKSSKVVVLDDQAMPGGQIWRSVEDVAARNDLHIFGKDYYRGLRFVQQFRASGIQYRQRARVIGIEDWDTGSGSDLIYLHDGKVKRLSAKRLIIATGSYERPTPFPGWTLPGVMSAGAAQIALKTTNMVPKRPFVLAGQGPLFLLLASQLKAAEVPPDVILQLDDPKRIKQALLHLPAALTGTQDLLKGLFWRLKITRGIKTSVGNVINIEAHGEKQLERISWKTQNGAVGECSASTLLIHDGVVPNTQLLRAMRAPIWYDNKEAAWRPSLASIAGQMSDRPWIYAAGDVSGIGGWRAAIAMGALAGASANYTLGNGSITNSEEMRSLGRGKAIRPFLNALYPPARAFHKPANSTIICRCEEISAGEIRKAVREGAQGPNQMKAFLRCGMGPCQGRMCADKTVELIAESNGAAINEVLPMRVRMPISPVTLGEMATLDKK